MVQVNGQLFDLYTAAGFGIAAYFWRRHAWPRAPFVIAFILGGLIETNLTLTVQLVELGRVHPFERPAALALVALIALSLVWMRRNRSADRKREQAPDADLPLGAITLVLAALLLALALAGGPAYSAYVRAAAAAALVLVTGVVLRAAIRRGSGAAMATMWTPLAPPQAHRLPLLMVAVLPLLVWAAGLVAGIGLTVLAWYAFRAGRPGAKSAAAAVAASAVYVALAFWFVNEVADVSLPKGWLWQ